MMRVGRYILTVVIAMLLSAGSLSAQSDDGSEASPVERYLPPTPQSAALARYGEHPVDLSTGLIDISVPVYTLSLGDFTLPVTLSYHAAGIRASDISTPVGLGWTLNAGGSISRTIIGRPDPVGEDLGSNGKRIAYKYRDYHAVDSVVRSARDIMMVHRLASAASELPEFDLEADRFTFNFCGHSGVMRYDHHSGRFRPLNYDILDIRPRSVNSESYFIVVDANGYEYVFRDHECSGFSDEATPPVTSWYLSEIHTPWGKIEFQYTRTERYFVQNPPSISGFVGEKLEFDSENYETIRTVTEQETFLGYSGIHYDEIILSKILWQGNHIDFEYDNGRHVRLGAHEPVDLGRLKSVKVYSSADECVKSVSLTHTTWGNIAENSRMLLTEVSASDEGKYTFGYNTESGYLPNYVSSGERDYYGYFNGSSSDIPTEVFDEAIKVWNNFSDRKINSRKFTSGNLNPDALKMQRGILQSITYPTGGHTHLEYEPHSDYNGRLYGGLRIKRILSHPDFGSPSVEKTFSYEGVSRYPDPEKLMLSVRHVPHNLPDGLIFTSHLSVSSSPYTFLSGGLACPVAYSKVTMTQGDTKTISTFSSSMLGDDYLLYRVSDFMDEYPRLLGCDMIPGACHDEGNTPMLLTAKTVTDPAGTALYSEKWDYQGWTIDEFGAGVRIVKTNTCNNESWNNLSFLLGKDCLDYKEVSCVVKTFQNVKKTVTDHTTGFTSEETLQYDTGEWRTLLPTSVSTLMSDGSRQVTEIEYVAHRADEHSQHLAEFYHNTDAVRRTTTKSGDVVTSRTAIEYGMVSNANSSFVLPEVKYTAIGSEALSERERMSGFNAYGNPSKIVVEQSDTTVLEWQAGILLKSVTSPGGFSTSYTHRPLMGVASVTDPRGSVTQYTYHPDGRLATVSDHRGILRQYQYNISSRDGGSNSVTEVTRLAHAPERKVTAVQYFDGLGRPSVKIDNSASPLLKFACVAQKYDNRGRVTATSLPAIGSSAAELPSASDLSQMLSITYDGDSSPWTSVRYDGLDRVIAEQSPGEDIAQAGKERTTAYISNSRNSVRLYQAPVGNTSLEKAGYYAPGTLMGEKKTDEDGMALTVFTDRAGRKVLERRGSDNDTYFVYNAYGQLRFILSPEYQHAGYRDKYAYEFRYDALGRMVKQILPGQKATQWWYDRAGRVIFEQTPRLAERNLHRFMLYDRAGRLCVQGITDRSSRSEAVNLVSYSGQGDMGGYLPADPSRLDAVRLEVANYYDSYAFLSRYNITLPAAAAGMASANGLLTGRMQTLSDDSQMLEVYFYDLSGNVMATVSYGPFGREATAVNTYQLCGNPVTSEYRVGDITYKVENVYGYGNNSRSRCVVEINGVSNMILSESRDDLGRLTALRKGSDSYEGRYTYNVRSQLTEIRWDNPAINFAQRLYYTSGPGTPRYNGYISAMAWKIGRGDNRIRGYRYTYNLMGWLTEAAYGENESLGTNPNRYTERVLEYTANGVIKRFQRHGLKDDGIYGKIDNLHLQLDGNYITGVTDDAAPVTRYANADIHPSADAGAHYLYDTSGALTRDLDRGVELIEYDLADNPQRIIFTSGAQTHYVYTPSGQKVRTIHLIPDVSLTGQATQVVADTTDYVGPIVYRGGAAEMLCYEGGYATFAQGSDPEYHYYVTDYQGNHRGVFSGSTGEMEQVTHYYPFGAVYADRGRGASVQPYKHGGKELDLMHGLYHYDYLARPYDPLLCIFTSPDSRATSYPHLHPRAFCANNPINYVDPDGNRIIVCEDRINYEFRSENGIYGFYNSAGKLYEGQGYIKKVEAALNKLMAKPIGNLIVQGVLMSQDFVKIMTPSLNNINTAGENGAENNAYKSNSRLIWDSDEDYEAPGFIRLGHEMAHAYDDKVLGSIDYTEWSKDKDGNVIMKSEIFAGQIENFIRQEHGLQPRTGYTEKPVKNQPSTFYFSHPYFNIRPNKNNLQLWKSTSVPFYH